MTHLLTSVPSSALPPGELGRMLADYVALDQARVYRRLLVTRFGILAAIAVLIDLLVPNLTMAMRSVPLVLFLSPPVWAWITELRLERRLSHRLDGVEGVVTHEAPRVVELDDC